MHTSRISQPAQFRARPTVGTWFERLGLLVAGAVLAAMYLWTYVHHPALPVSSEQMGWFKWFDQEWYFKAAIAWSTGNFDPTQHFYLPGYALLGAPFAKFIPLHTFLIPNLIYVLTSLWLFSAICARLAVEIPFARLLGAAVFLLCTAFKPEILEVWVVPNSSSASTPVIYATMLAALIFIERPRPLFAFWAALLACAVPFFRPTDMVPLVAGTGVGMLIAMYRERLGIGRGGRIVVAALLGAAISFGVLGILHLLLYGPNESGYMKIGNLVGFEWSLLPYRLVLLVIDPRPYLMDGEGLAGRFPWVIPGLIGCIALIIVPPIRSRRMVECVVVGAILLHIAIYCVFRDLQPINLIRFTNYHYFKWLFPFLALYAVRLAFNLLAGRERLRLTATAVLTALIVFPWRVELRALPSGDAPPATFADNTVSFQTDLSTVQNTVLIAATDANKDSTNGLLTVAGRSWGGLVDFRVYPQPSGMMLAVLRPLGRGEAILKADPGIKLNPEIAPINARLQIVFGLPCLVLSERPVCQATDLIPAPPFPADRKLTLDAAATRYQTTGWSFDQPDGTWTDGRLVGLRFHLNDVPAGSALQFKMDAAAYMPPGAGPLQVRLQVNAHPVQQWTLASGAKTTLSATIPPEFVGEKRDINLSLRIDNARSPAESGPGSRDTRKLGLFVNAMSLAF